MTGKGAGLRTLQTAVMRKALVGLHLTAVISIVLAGVSLLIILIDLLAGNAQQMPIMNVVWPLTALYGGPLALLAYYKIGRLSTGNWRNIKVSEQKRRSLSGKR